MTADPSPSATPDSAPGEDSDSFLSGSLGYIVGLVLALALTATAFWASQSELLWRPGIPIGLCVLAIAQMGIHLVFFLHITTGPDNTNNVLALAFGLIIVFLVIAGSLWIMANLSEQMMPMAHVTRMPS